MNKNHQWVMMILIKIKGPLINNAIYEFSSKSGVVCLMGFLHPQQSPKIMKFRG
jgi:hypothetical protein